MPPTNPAENSSATDAESIDLKIKRLTAEKLDAEIRSLQSPSWRGYPFWVAVITAVIGFATAVFQYASNDLEFQRSEILRLRNEDRLEELMAENARLLTDVTNLRGNAALLAEEQKRKEAAVRELAKLLSANARLSDLLKNGDFNTAIKDATFPIRRTYEPIAAFESAGARKSTGAISLTREGKLSVTLAVTDAATALRLPKCQLVLRSADSAATIAEFPVNPPTLSAATRTVMSSRTVGPGAEVQIPREIRYYAGSVEAEFELTPEQIEQVLLPTQISLEQVNQP